MNNPFGGELIGSMLLVIFEDGVVVSIEGTDVCEDLQSQEVGNI